MSSAASKGAPMLTKSGYLHKRSFKNQHKDVVNCFVVAKIQNPGGKGETEYLFTGSSDTKMDKEGRGGNIIQWVLETNALVKTFDLIDPEQEKLEEKGRGGFFGGTTAKKPKFGHREGVTCLAVSKGFLYSGSFDKRVIKWDIRTHTQVAVFEGHTEAVYRISVQDVWLLSVSRDATVRVWQDTNSQCIAILKGHTAPILSLAVVDTVLYTGSDDCSIRQWEWHSGAQTREYHGHTDGVTDLKAAGENLFSCSFDSTVRMWGIKSGQCVRICQADSGLRGLAIAAGKIFGAGNNAMLYIWDQNTTSTDPLASDRLARGGLTMVTVEGHNVLASSADKTVRMWEKVSVSQASGGKGAAAHDEAAASAHVASGAAPLAFLGGASSCARNAVHVLWVGC